MKTITPRGRLYQNNGISAFIVLGGKHESNLVEIADFLETTIAKNTEKFSEEYRQAENKHHVDMMHSRLRLSHRNLIEAQRDHNKRVATTNAPAALTDPAWESEFRQHIRSLPLADRAAAVADLSFAQSSALVRYGDIDRLGLPGPSVAAVRERHRVSAVVEIGGLRANHAKRGSLSNPLPGGGVDNAAAFAEGEANIAALDAEGEMLGHEATGLAGIVQIAAVASGQDARALWTELTE